MQTGTEEFVRWLEEEEGSRFEFKEAKTAYHFGELGKYCAAIANEGAGKMILGVTERAAI